MLNKKSLKLIAILFILILGFVFYRLFFRKNALYEGDFKSEKNKITINDDGFEYEIKNVRQQTISEFLSEKKISLGDEDFVFPQKESKIYGGMKLTIKRKKNISILVDGKTIKGDTFGNNVAIALWDNEVKMEEDDFSIPEIDSLIKDKSKIEVVRVDISEEKVKKEIDFEKKITEDEKLGWRIKKVSQKGVKGIDEYKYRIISHNGKEISRKLLGKERISDPIPEISVQGTYMKLGKVNNGLGTWYSWKKGLFAASPWLPMGSYAKVTNKENGKSVVVQINDRGPFGPNRIIDLDKVAFEKIASLGAGVIDVKVEQVLN